MKFERLLLGHAQLTAAGIYTHVTIAKLKEVHALTHPAERERVRASDRPALDVEHETLLSALAEEESEAGTD